MKNASKAEKIYFFFPCGIFFRLEAVLLRFSFAEMDKDSFPVTRGTKICLKLVMVY